jgi:hypothetical protein
MVLGGRICSAWAEGALCRGFVHAADCIFLNRPNELALTGIFLAGIYPGLI